MAPPATPIDEARLISLRRNGMTINDIATTMRVNRKRIEYALRKLTERRIIEPYSVGGSFWKERDKAVLRDMMTGGSSNAEIAARLGRTEQAVQAQIVRQRAALRKATSEAPPPEPATLEPVPADWRTILEWGMRIKERPLTLAIINAGRIGQGVSPYVPVEPYAAWKRRVAA